MATIGGAIPLMATWIERTLMPGIFQALLEAIRIAAIGGNRVNVVAASVSRVAVPLALSVPMSAATPAIAIAIAVTITLIASTPSRPAATATTCAIVLVIARGTRSMMNRERTRLDERKRLLPA